MRQAVEAQLAAQMRCLALQSMLQSMLDGRVGRGVGAKRSRKATSVCPRMLLVQSMPIARDQATAPNPLAKGASITYRDRLSTATPKSAVNN